MSPTRIETGDKRRDARMNYLLESLDWILAQGDACPNCGQKIADMEPGWSIRFHQDAKCAEKS